MGSFSRQRLKALLSWLLQQVTRSLTPQEVDLFAARDVHSLWWPFCSLALYATILSTITFFWQKDWRPALHSDAVRLAEGVLCACFASQVLGLSASLLINIASVQEQQLRRARVTLAVAATIAAVAHGLTALNVVMPEAHGFYGHKVVVSNYFQWTCTSPLMVIVVGQLAMLPRGWTIASAFSQQLCIIFGLAASLASRLWWRWVALSLSFLFMVPPLLLFLQWKVPLQHIPTGVHGEIETVLAYPIMPQRYGAVAVLLWSVYPVLWLADALDLLGPDTSGVFLSVVDLTVKIIFTRMVFEFCLDCSVSAHNCQLIVLRATNMQQNRFLRYVFHEVRVPFNSVMLGVENLREENALDAFHPVLDDMMQGLQVMSKVLDDVLCLSMVDQGKMHLSTDPFDPSQCLQDSLSSFTVMANDKEVKLLLRFEDETHRCLLGDSFRLKQVLNNLLSNGIKFSAQGSTVEVEASVVPMPPPGNTGPQPEHALLAVHVKDSGVGIREEDKGCLFKEFHQIRPHELQGGRGSGLGLAIARRVTTLQGGRIWFTSEHEKGSVFSFEIPYLFAPDSPEVTTTSSNNVGQLRPALAPAITTLPQLPPSPAGSPRTGGSSSRQTCLVVDDVKANRMLLCMMLGKMGFECSSACNGREAVDRSTKAGFSLIFMDLTMPVMDGIEATHIICQSGSPSKIIGVTGNAMGEDSERFLKAGALVVLTKPVTKKAIEAALATAKERWKKVS